MNSLPDEILNKIFKRIDTSSCQTLDSCRTKNSNPEIKDRSTEEETKKLCTPFEFVCKYSETKIYEPKEDSRQPTDLDPVDQKVVSDSKFGDVERKTSNFTDSSTTCNSKESFQAEMKNSLNFLPYSPSEFVKLSNKMGGMNEFEKKAYLRPKRQETESLNYSKSRHRVMRHYDKDSAEDGISSLDRSLNSKRSWLSRYEDISAGHEHRNFPVKDSCGLQEKLDISYQELPRNSK